MIVWAALTESEGHRCKLVALMAISAAVRKMWGCNEFGS